MEFEQVLEVIEEAAAAHEEIPAYARRKEWTYTKSETGVTTNVPIGIWKRYIKEEVFAECVKPTGEEYSIKMW